MTSQLAELIAKGSVKVEMLHFPLRPESVWAVEAVECAGEQGFWWAMHDKILQNQSNGVTTQRMKDYAKEMGLDTKAFNQCIDSDRYVQTAKDGRAAGDKLGVQGTPTFFVNGRQLQLQTWNDILAAVNKELSK